MHLIKRLKLFSNNNKKTQFGTKFLFKGGRVYFDIKQPRRDCIKIYILQI